VLAPGEDGLHVWQHRDRWVEVQTLADTPEVELSPTLDPPGYTTWHRLNLCVSDLDGDGRDELLTRRRSGGGSQSWQMRVQEPDGRLASEPAWTWEAPQDWRSWVCWVDLDRDGRADLIHTTWLDEAWFLPGTRSGKVLVRVYYRDAQGRIPAEPRQVFRKNDWMNAVPVVDVDGDGHPDLVLGYSAFDSREGLRKMVTAKELDFTLKLHFYRRGGGYPAEPDCQREVVLRLDRSSLLLSWSRRDYLGRLVALRGDFDGDGRLDLLARDRSDAISAYRFLSHEKGFAREAMFQFRCPEPVDAFEPRELNGDGVSDLVVTLRKTGSLRVFLSRKDANRRS
jgi:hypothetical protein